MKNKTYPKYGNKASLKLAKEVQKANNSIQAQIEIKELKRSILNTPEPTDVKINL